MQAIKKQQGKNLGYLFKGDDKFLEGVSSGLAIIFKIFPTIFAMMICINVLLKSNIINDLVSLISPDDNSSRYKDFLFCIDNKIINKLIKERGMHK